MCCIRDMNKAHWGFWFTVKHVRKGFLEEVVSEFCSLNIVEKVKIYSKQRAQHGQGNRGVKQQCV